MPDLARTLELLRETDARLVAVGHGRRPEHVDAAAQFLAAWQGEIAAIVDWPANAASWLQPAQRLTANAPDALVIADRPEGWANIEQRLETWDPMRTVFLR
jgi:hypothetical protein